MVIPAIFGSIKRWATSGLTYLLYDDFTTPEAAPLTSPRTCEPGPGTLVISDSYSALSISGGSIVSVGVAGARKLSASAMQPGSMAVCTGTLGVTGVAGSSLRIVITTASVTSDISAIVSSSGFSMRRGLDTPVLFDPENTSGSEAVFSLVNVDGTVSILSKRSSMSWYLLAVFYGAAAPLGTDFIPYNVAGGPELLVDSVAIINLADISNANPLGTDWTDPSSLAIVYDTFTDTDGTLLTAHSPEKGGPWVVSGGGGVEILSDTAIAPDGTQVVTTETSKSDVIVAGLCSGTPSTVNFGIVFRVLDTTTSYSCWALVRTATQIRLNEMNSGVATARGSTTKSLTSGQSLIARCHGTDIRTFHMTATGVYTALTSYTSSVHQSNTRHGMALVSPGTMDEMVIYPVDISTSFPVGV